MVYIPDRLMPYEKVLFAAHVHSAVLVPSFFILLVAFLLFGLGFSQAVDLRAVGDPAPEVNEEQTFLGMSLVYISIPLFLYSIWLGFQALLMRSTTELGITNRRLMATTGFLHKHTLDMRLPEIESVTVRQTTLGRLFNFGTVTIAGKDATQESFRGIAAPLLVQNRIREMIEGSRKAYKPNPGPNATSPEIGG